MTPLIREETAGDFPLVREGHLDAFGSNGAEVAPLVDALRLSLSAEPGLSLVAVEDDVVVGHACLAGSPDYYSQQGFVAGDSLRFRKPSLRIPDPAFQVYPLSSYQPWMTGTLVYRSEFWTHDCVGLREE